MALDANSMTSRTPRGQVNVTGSLLGVPPPKLRQLQLQKPLEVIKSQDFFDNNHRTVTKFRQFYDRGDIPIAVDNDVTGCKAIWKMKIDLLDFHYFLPLFFDGLREVEDPWMSLAKRGVHDMLEHGGRKILPVVPQLIIPIKMALETRDKIIICRTLEALQYLIKSADGAGEALVPYYRQILPVLNRFKHKNVNTGDRICYDQKKHDNLGDIINDTLQLMEKYGGPEAYINIKYMVPTYEST